MVMDTVQYLQEGLKELANPDTYVELDSDVTQATATRANELLVKYKDLGMLSKYTCDRYSTPLDTVRTQRMYFLRKVHKTPHQLRPIVSCCGGPTQKLSQLTNDLLRDYLHGVPSLVSSSTQVIHAIESLSIPPASRDKLLLATLDIKALYPSIPQGLGVAFALQQAIPTDPPNSNAHPLKSMLKELLLHILQQNTFEFAARNFRQIRGVAMGTPVAPTLANLFMGKVEKDALMTWKGTQPLVWLRYIDDILMILEDSHLVLAELLTHLNARISSIKFTEEHSYNSIDFLDLTLFKGPRFQATGTLDIRPFAKLIDPHAYLHFSSGHHRSVTLGLVKGEFVRTLRRSSSPEIYASAVIDVMDWFTNRGYSKRIVKSVADKIKYEDRVSFLQNATNRSLPECTTILSVRNHPALKSAALKEALTDLVLPFSPLVARRAPATVSSLIVKAGTPSTSDAARYHLRSREVGLTKEQFMNYAPPP